jgi:hypothetical protein
MKKKKTYILSIENDDQKKELEFEVAFQLSLSSSQRYKRMIKMFKQNKTIINKNERKKTPAVISRA